MYDNEKILIKSAQLGSSTCMEKLIILNNGLIWSIVQKFWYTEIDKEDLYQIACIGFIKSIKRFNFSYNVKLSTYATEYIYGEIKKFLRDDGIIKISRNIKELNKKIKEIEKNHNKNFTSKELANILNVEEENIILALTSRKKVESINQFMYHNNSISTKSEYISYDSNYENALLEKICISESLDNLNFRDKTIITLRFFKEKSQSQIAKMLGISQVQVSRLEKKALCKLKKELVRGE